MVNLGDLLPLSPIRTTKYSLRVVRLEGSVKSGEERKGARVSQAHASSIWYNSPSLYSRTLPFLSKKSSARG
jgi:hypothetical protein